MHATGTHIGCMHARARSALIENHELFALLKPPKRRRQRTDVERLRRDVEHMGENTADLGIEHTDKLPAERHFDSQKLFDCQGKSVLLIHRRHVVEAIEIRDGLKIRLGLDQLFGATMQQADMGIDALDHFAVELEDEPQNTVSRRMLRAEVNVERANVVLGHCLAFSSPGST